MVGNRFILCSVAWLLLAGNLFGQDNRYMVSFKDKIGTPYTIEQPQQFLSKKSLDRRSKQNILVTDQDLPVNPSYIAMVKATGAKIRYPTKWFNAVLIEATSAQKNVVASLPNVLSVELVAPGKTGTGGRIRSKSKMESSDALEATQNQNSISGLDEMHNDGLTGEGITIAVFDTGFPGVNTNPAFADIFKEGRIVDSYNFSYGQLNVFTGHDHGARVFSIIAGNLPSTFTGGVIDARYLLYATEFDPTEYRVEEYNWTFAAERADSVGADIISSSLGYTEFDDPAMDYSTQNLDGKTTVISRAAEFAFDRGIVVVVSAGNFGNDPWHFIGAPADGPNVIAVGSITSNYTQSSFSSFGPTADGRIKPDVMAMGTGVASVLSGGTIAYGNGTSFACPVITSLVAGVWQRWPELSAIEMVTLLRISSSNSSNPNNSFGYGIPTYRAIKNLLDSPKPGTAILVYPNPVENDELKIALSQSDGSLVEVILQNSLGITLQTFSYEAIWLWNPFRLEMAGLSPGVYYLKVGYKKTIKTFRIVK